jgi:ABC-type uncharacterized transport system fused permease/ATPase subunit
MGEVTADQAPSQEGALSRLTAVRLARAIRNFATSEVGTRAAALAGLLLALLLAINGLKVVNSSVGRYFMTALERRDSDDSSGRHCSTSGSSRPRPSRRSW